MEEQLVSFETAKLAKEKGFPSINTGLNKMYTEEGHFYNSVGPTFDESSSYQAPTQSLLQKWLREKHNIIVEVKPIEWYSPKFVFYLLIWHKDTIIQIKRTEKDLPKIKWEFFNYEKALEKGLFEALKLI